MGAGLSQVRHQLCESRRCGPREGWTHGRQSTLHVRALSTKTKQRCPTPFSYTCEPPHSIRTRAGPSTDWGLKCGLGGRRNTPMKHLACKKTRWSRPRMYLYYDLFCSQQLWKICVIPLRYCMRCRGAPENPTECRCIRWYLSARCMPQDKSICSCCSAQRSPTNVMLTRVRTVV